MSSEVLSCPYCNSTVTLLSPPRKGQRLRCPRCDELIPYSRGEEGLAEEDRLDSMVEPESASLVQDLDQLYSTPRRWSNRSLAVAILSVMGLMATIGLIFAWYTTELRRRRDHLNTASAPAMPEIVAVTPAKLAALGYLPSDTNVIVGIHVAELTAHAENRDLLLQLRGETFGIDKLEQWTGLTLDELDHAVLGLKVGDRLLPRFTLVVQTRQPYDADKVLSMLKVSRHSKRGDKTLHRFSLKQPSLDGVLWRADNRTLVISLLPEDLDDVPLKPASDIARFESPLPEFLTERLHEDTQLWAIGHVGEWEKLLGLLSIQGLANADRNALGKLRGVVAWVQFKGEVTWDLAGNCTDRDAAAALERVLDRWGLANGKPVKILGDRQNLQPLAQELSRTLTRHRADNWVTLEARTGNAVIRQALRSP